MTHPDSVPCIIMLLSVGGDDGAERLLVRLRGLGVEFDDAYGLIPLGPAPSSFVTRGLVPPGVAASMAGDEQVAFFPDLGVGPADG